MGDDYEPYEWQVGDPADWGDSVGVPDIPYMGYIDGDDDDGDDWEPPRNSRSAYVQELVDRALNLKDQRRHWEAVAVINMAIEESPNDFNLYNIRAIIWEDKGEFEHALKDYNRSLAMFNSQVVKNNKARLLWMMSNDEKFYTKNYNKALEYINEALKFTADEDDRKKFLRSKGEILDLMEKWKEAYICYLLAADLYDKVERVEEQEKQLKNTTDTLICIAGTRFYHDHKPLNDGETVDLIRESDNEHDSDAIRVEIDGKTAGYVANSTNTLIREAKSASEIKDMIKDRAKAKIMFTYIDRYVIAKLI